MKKRLMIILAAVLVAGLVPAAAAAKPKPPEPPGPPPTPTLEACVFLEDGVTLDYAGGGPSDPGYWCVWTPSAVTSWLITVAPREVAANIAVAVKYEHPGEPCAYASAEGKTIAPDVVSIVADLSGNCGGDNPDGGFVLWVDATVRKGDTVEVTVVGQ